MNTGTATLSESGNRANFHSPSKAYRALFAFCSFASAFLLFQVQLIVSKCILPWFGGSAAVWTTALLVFQVLLLAGYSYSHLLVLRHSPKNQSRVQIGLLSAGFIAVGVLSFAWPSAVTPGAAWKTIAGGHPALGVAYSILAAAGLPFFILSTTAPLLQSWFARLGGGSGSYRLYAVSNVGSLLGLLSYPVVIEPSLRLARQGQMWAALFCAYAVSCMVCAWLVGEAGGKEEWQAGRQEAQANPSSSRWYIRAMWFLLPACGSALLLSTTNKVCQEVASVPLLWVVPLAFYLLSFILCFDHPRWYRRAIVHPAFAISLFTICFSSQSNPASMVAQLVAIPVALFTGCMICHGELSLLKPGAKQLTSFYLAISAGGAAGGMFVAILSPMIFKSFVEFQLSLALVVVLMLAAVAIDDTSWVYRRDLWTPLAITAGTVAIVFMNGKLNPESAEFVNSIYFYPVVLLLAGLAVAITFAMKKLGIAEHNRFRPIHLLLACEVVFTCVALYKTVRPEANLVLSRRNFYGVIKVLRWPSSIELIHGGTIHGEQLDPPFDSFPTAYYGRQSGIGILLENHPKRNMGQRNLRIGVVGLGAGTLAAYGHASDSIRFYEIDPNMVSLCDGPNVTFTFLHNSPAKIAVVLGDARLSLEKEPPVEGSKYDVMVLDAFSGDAIPIHLLTKEAFAGYLDRVDPDYGVIAVHVSSNHVNLLPVLQGLAGHFGMDMLNAYNRMEFQRGPVFASDWVLLSRRKFLRGIPELASLEAASHDETLPVLWTDDYSNVFRLLRLENEF